MSNTTGNGLLSGKWPAVIDSYDPAARTCMVSIPGITDGGESGLEAEIEYPIGDKSRHGTMTEIEILPGDLVWVEFIQGDPRYPLITGWRNPTTGNDTTYRRWHHANIEALADQLICLMAGDEFRAKASAAMQLESGDEMRLASGAAAKVEAGADGQITAGGKILIMAKGGPIILQSATGVLVV